MNLRAILMISLTGVALAACGGDNGSSSTASIDACVKKRSYEHTSGGDPFGSKRDKCRALAAKGDLEEDGSLKPGA